MQHDSARRPASATRERVLDLAFLLGVLFKGIDGAFELVAGVALLFLGSRRIYPWAIGALTLFLVYQVYELVVAPSVFVLVLTLFDAVIIALTWREWRHGRTLRETMRTTVDWVFRRSAPRP